jgi:hypothetical protein
MNQPRKPSVNPDIIIADGEELNLHNRFLAAVLAWLVPGAGHYYQQRYLKSAVFFVCIVTTFVIGISVSGGRCVYASWNSTEVRWQFVLQSGIGLPALPAAYQWWLVKNNKEPLFRGAMTGPLSTNDLDDWNKATASGFDMGTLYTMVAGLLNILVVFDAYAGPLPPPVPKPNAKKGKTARGNSPPEAADEPKSEPPPESGSRVDKPKTTAKRKS